VRDPRAVRADRARADKEGEGGVRMGGGGEAGQAGGGGEGGGGFAEGAPGAAGGGGLLCPVSGRALVSERALPKADGGGGGGGGEGGGGLGGHCLREGRAVQQRLWPGGAPSSPYPSSPYPSGPQPTAAPRQPSASALRGAGGAGGQGLLRQGAVLRRSRVLRAPGLLPTAAALPEEGAAGGERGASSGTGVGGGGTLVRSTLHSAKGVEGGGAGGAGLSRGGRGALWSAKSRARAAGAAHRLRDGALNAAVHWQRMQRRNGAPSAAAAAASASASSPAAAVCAGQEGAGQEGAEQRLLSEWATASFPVLLVARRCRSACSCAHCPYKVGCVLTAPTLLR
jgi:hypothetical protein